MEQSIQEWTKWNLKAVFPKFHLVHIIYRSVKVSITVSKLRHLLRQNQ